MTFRDFFTAIGDGFQSIGQFTHDFGSAFLNADIEVTAIQLAPFLAIVGFIWVVGQVGKALRIRERRQIEQRERELEREWGELP